jgi:hypothetical protein
VVGVYFKGLSLHLAGGHGERYEESSSLYVSCSRLYNLYPFICLEDMTNGTRTLPHCMSPVRDYTTWNSEIRRRNPNHYTSRSDEEFFWTVCSQIPRAPSFGGSEEKNGMLRSAQLLPMSSRSMCVSDLNSLATRYKTCKWANSLMQ